MTSALTDVSRLSVDNAAARLRTGRITVRTDGPTRLSVAHLPPGTRVTVDGAEWRRRTGAGA